MGSGLRKGKTKLSACRNNSGVSPELFFLYLRVLVYCTGMKKLIIFDWDDVIILGAKKGYYRCYEETLNELGVKYVIPDVTQIESVLENL